MTIRYLPPMYEFFTFHVYFHTQTHLHIRTYFTTTSNNTRCKKSKYRIFTPKFTTWTTDTLVGTSSTNTSDTPSQGTPLQPFAHSQPQPFTPTQTHHTSPKPHKPQDKQPSPVKTNVNPPTQPSIPDKEKQHIPKSTNGNQLKRSKPQPRQKDECLCFYCNQLGHLKRNCPELPYCSKCRTRGHTPDKCNTKPQRNGPTCEANEESRDQ